MSPNGHLKNVLALLSLPPSEAGRKAPAAHVFPSRAPGQPSAPGPAHIRQMGPVARPCSCQWFVTRAAPGGSRVLGVSRFARVYGLWSGSLEEILWCIEWMGCHSSFSIQRCILRKRQIPPALYWYFSASSLCICIARDSYPKI